jgi:amino acid permease
MNTNDIIGTIGVGIILLAYFLNIFSWIKKDGVLFYMMNIVGASIACFTSYLINYIPFVILEGTWAIVSVIGLQKSIKKPQANT